VSRSETSEDPTPARRAYNVVEDIGIRIRFTFPDLLAIEDDGEKSADVDRDHADR
jgi:hypothetical protein